MRRGRWIAGLVLGLLAGCGTTVSGTATAPGPESGRQPGLLLALKNADRDSLVLIDRKGQVQQTIALPGVSAATRDVGNGRVLVDSDAGMAIVDTRSATVTPVTFDHPDRAEDLRPNGHPPLARGVAQAGDYLLLGEPTGRYLGLLNLTTGKGVALERFLDVKFIGAASLDPTGTWVTVLSDQGVAVGPTADPGRLAGVLPDRSTTVGAISLDGSRFATVVGRPGEQSGQIFVGVPGGPTTDTGRQARSAFPLAGGRTIFFGDDGDAVIVDAGGVETRIDGLGDKPRIVTETQTFLVLTGSARTVHVRLGDPVVATPQELDLSEVAPVTGSDPAGATVALRPIAGQQDTALTVVDAAGVRKIAGLDRFDVTSLLQVPGDRVVLGQRQPVRSQVVDLVTGKPVLTADGSVRAVAPDGKAFAVVDDGKSSIVSDDGSEPLDLGAVTVLAWATG